MMKSKKSTFLLLFMLVFCGMPQEVKPVDPVTSAVVFVVAPWVLGICTAIGVVVFTGVKVVKYSAKACFDLGKDCYRSMTHRDVAKDFVASAEKIRDYSANVQIFSAHKAGKRSQVLNESLFSCTSLYELMEKVNSFIDKHDDDNRVYVQPYITLVSGRRFVLSDFKDNAKNSDILVQLLFESLYVPQRKKKDHHSQVSVVQEDSFDSELPKTGPYYGARDRRHSVALLDE